MSLHSDVLDEDSVLPAYMSDEYAYRTPERAPLRARALLALELDHTWITALREKDIKDPALPDEVVAVIHHLGEVLAPLSVYAHDLFDQGQIHRTLTESYLEDGFGGLSAQVVFLARVVGALVRLDLAA
ncbi:hypothetical protein MRI28_11825 [Nocardiopsis dassonvillei]|uniref:hypothetical protein n=1 Tax=Nocardiopsis dassonvillei TaxID=2014 RepID=UPI00200C6268|nr:hypothetical protein [Nocardiopsis dassonvillei]MCK9870320.1 hypothetical protein [Nocardiopsis dassonvillei]